MTTTRETKPTTKTSTETGPKTGTKKSTTGGFSSEERAAMQARAAEVRTGGRSKDKASAEAQACLDAIAALPPADRKLAARVHELVTEAAPGLAPKTWYGMPAYAADGKVVCYFKAASKFKTRYAQFGFEADANLDDGTMWPTVFAITGLSDAEERAIARLVEKAAG
jgi:uncharacterized protein YdhG (YjbR/CyaY superfamily)